MRRLQLLALALVLSTPVLRAQSLDAFKDHLAAPVRTESAPTGAQVRVTEQGDAAQAVAQASRNTPQRIRGYRVCIFFDNGQTARAGAVAAKALFEETYSGIPVYMVYENPYFKVSVGNCLTSEEAIVLKGKVSGAFPKAFLKSEELSLADFSN